VRRRCTPAVREIAFAGADEARPQPEFLAALSDRNLRAVVICPSNPFISVDPILALPGVREALRACPAPVVAVSPIIGGKAVKGPAAKMMAELGYQVSSLTIAQKYRGLIDGMVIDMADADLAADIRGLGMAVKTTRTLMLSPEDSAALAAETVAFARIKLGYYGGMRHINANGILPLGPMDAGVRRQLIRQRIQQGCPSPKFDPAGSG